MNNVVIMGRLTVDPELKKTPAGVSITTFVVAVNRSYVPKGQERQADFIDVVAWRSTAEFITKYFRKGQMIAVQGSIQTRSYEDKQGNKRKAVEISADNVYFADSKGSSQGGQHNNSYGAPDYSSAPAPAAPSFSQGSADDFAVVDDNEDLPF